MAIVTIRRHVRTRGQGDCQDVTAMVTEGIGDSALADGSVLVFVVGSTAAVTTIEYEPGAIADFERLLETLAPRHGHYEHHLAWGDDNGSSHVRAALIGSSLTIPFVSGTPILGTWQQIVLIECDTRPREREIVLQVQGQPAGT